MVKIISQILANSILIHVLVISIKKFKYSSNIPKVGNMKKETEINH